MAHNLRQLCNSMIANHTIVVVGNNIMMDLIFQPWNNWMLMALLTPMLWAFACMMDVCFVGGDVYKSPYDGALISGFFYLIPMALGLTLIDNWAQINALSAMMAIFAGMAYFLHVLTYFKALFALNDASNVEIFNTLSVLFVPILAFVFFGERLEDIYYVAILLAFAGVVILIRNYLSAIPNSMVGLLLLSVIFVSMAMVMQAWVFTQMDYWNGVVLFSIGNLAAALVALGMKRSRRVRVLNLCRRYWPVFFLAELIELAAVLSSQRATDIGPSVSLVAVVECSLPLFIMVLSVTILNIPGNRVWLSGDIRAALALQISALPVKLISLGLIGTAIALI